MEATAARFRTRDIAYIAVFVALMAICSWISIPTTVPFTLQTMAVFLAVGILGGRRGALAGILMSSTGGYIIGFLFTALLMWAMERFLGSRAWVLGVSMVLGLLVCYAFGTAWFMYIYLRDTGAVTLAAALGWCVIPFLFPDLVKIALALFLSSRLRRYVK